MLFFIMDARNAATSSGRRMAQNSAFFLRMAIRVSQIRGLDVGDQPRFEARAEPLLDVRDLLGLPVAREHDLLL